MAAKGLLGAFTLLVVGGAIGAAGIIASTMINHATSTDHFCTGCHTMAVMATNSHFLKSRHEDNPAGIRVSCADCHIPTTSWFTETYTHAADGISDVIAELIHDYSNSAVWTARRNELAEKVRADMERNDSVTCRRCHDAATMRPRNESGRAAHAMSIASRLTCVQCHANLVHSVAAP